MFSLIGAWINGWVNNREAGDLRRRRAHYDVIVMVNIPVIYVGEDHEKWQQMQIWFNVSSWKKISRESVKLNTEVFCGNRTA